MEVVQAIVSACRSSRSNMQIKPKDRVHTYIVRAIRH